MTNKSFDERAATWDDDPSKVRRAELTANMIRSVIRLTGSERMLDYGAGTGLLSGALAADVGSLVLAEVSAGMREVIVAKRRQGTLPAGVEVWDLDLAVGPVPERRFELIAIVMTLHHVIDATGLLASFAELLEAGGHLCIVDLDVEDGSLHGPDFDGHFGFDRTELERDLIAVGFERVRFEPLLEIERQDRTYPVFFAVAERGARSG